jgi:bifunctional polynucleotide phosphatase/kinase
MSSWNWIIESNYIFGYDKDVIFKSSSNIDTVYMFDLDYTLIKTKSGKKFPESKTDWELLYPNVPEKLNILTNSLMGIISNQKGLNSKEKISDWIEKCVGICEQLKSINFVFASIVDDKYRKPLCGSCEIYKSTFVNVNWNKLEAKNKIYYVGDAFGRKDDFSDTDVKYALNCGYKFKTPEVFFGIKGSDKSGNITYPQINYFEKSEQDELFTELENLIKSHKKILVITIGLPASGKSFIRKELIKRFPQFTYSNNDDVQAKVQSRMLVKNISTDYDFIIDDNTNLIKEIRDGKLKQFDSYYKIGIWFDYDMEVCWHLNWMRMYWFGGKLLPKVTYYTLRKKFSSDDIDKGFNKFIKITKVFRELNLDNKIKYYF